MKYTLPLFVLTLTLASGVFAEVVVEEKGSKLNDGYAEMKVKPKPRKELVKEIQFYVNNGNYKKVRELADQALVETGEKVPDVCATDTSLVVNDSHIEKLKDDTEKVIESDASKTSSK